MQPLVVLSLRNLNDFSVLSAVLTLTVAWCLWTFVRGLYNIWFHPLSKYPGPKLAAFTIWWKAYVELFEEQNLVDKLFDLHREYGNIVRIGPNELHFARPSAYHEIYNPRNRWGKEPMLYTAFAEAESSFTILDYHGSKKRKDILLPLFSRKAIVDMQDLIQDCADQMCEGIARQYKDGKPTGILHAYRCFAIDAIFSFCFANTMGALTDPDFRPPVEVAMELSLPMITWIKYFPILKQFIAHCPPMLVTLLRPQLKGLIRMRGMLKAQVVEVTTHPEVLEKASHPIIYHELLNPKHGKKVPSLTSLRDEALLLVFAGSDTTSNTLTLATMHILSNPVVHKRLEKELLQAWPELSAKPRFEIVENLPYLRAVVKESLRLVHGTLTPMTRIVPPEGADIGGVHVPSGTIVATCNKFVHLNEEIFPEPDVFKPERWLDGSADSLEHWLVAFSKGPRSCLGVNLGYCEVFLGLANMFRRFELSLDSVTAADMHWKECYIAHYDGPELLVRAKPRT